MVALNSKHRINRKERKHIKAPKTSFPREQVEKADQDKLILNKIMATCDKHMKYNFVAPLATFCNIKFVKFFLSLVIFDCF